MADETKDFWAKSQRGLPDGWPHTAEGEPEQAAKLVLQSELDANADITISMLHSYGIPAFKDGTLGGFTARWNSAPPDCGAPCSRGSAQYEHPRHPLGHPGLLPTVIAEGGRGPWKKGVAICMDCRNHSLEVRPGGGGGLRGKRHTTCAFSRPCTPRRS
jgi:hypothetical protein